ncbi:MAG: hypothetical protein CM1200mP10_21590 [Candidatus Neomarinimicrobiota bacterium]|nr:MAG: hypothetical protein CM1200mP10_21590 [Candidatus Neomarinimicrobiota bacterium]
MVISLMLMVMAERGQMRGAGEIQFSQSNDGTNSYLLRLVVSLVSLPGFGQGLIEATGKRLMDKGFENFKKRIRVPGFDMPKYSSK